MESEKTTRISITIPKNLLEQVQQAVEDMGLKNRSKFISIALGNYIAKLSWMKEKGSIVGAVTLIYSHERGDVLKKLTHIQHEFLEIIKSSVHIHLDEERCLEVLCVVGDVEKVKKLVSSLESVAGLKGLEWAFFKI